MSYHFGKVLIKKQKKQKQNENKVSGWVRVGIERALLSRYGDIHLIIRITFLQYMYNTEVHLLLFAISSIINNRKSCYFDLV